MLAFICLLTLARAYVLKWLIRAYERPDVKQTAVIPDVSRGYTYLLSLVILLASLAFAIARTRQRGKPAQDLVK